MHFKNLTLYQILVGKLPGKKLIVNTVMQL